MEWRGEGEAAGRTHETAAFEDAELHELCQGQLQQAENGEVGQLQGWGWGCCVYVYVYVCVCVCGLRGGVKGRGCRGQLQREGPMRACTHTSLTRLVSYTHRRHTAPSPTGASSSPSSSSPSARRRPRAAARARRWTRER